MYKIIGDSCTEVSKSFVKDYPISIVPFKLFLDNTEYIDDAFLNIDDFVDKMKLVTSIPRTACPSPYDFLNLFEGEETEIFVVTISSKLSGAYNSAVLAKNIYEEENPNEKLIHVFDSLGASTGQTLIVKEIHELKTLNYTFEKIIETITEFILNTRVIFISESLDNLVSNGRIPAWKGFIAGALNIVPIMGSDGYGQIRLLEKIRGTNKAYSRLIEIIQSELNLSERNTIAIAHVENNDRASQLETEILELFNTKKVINLQCAGLSSIYADYKGIIVAF